MSAANFVGHRSMTFGSAWVEPIVIKRASVWRVWALAKIEALNDHELHWGKNLKNFCYFGLWGEYKLPPPPPMSKQCSTKYITYTSLMMQEV
jgi:hypothetical protein